MNLKYLEKTEYDNWNIFVDNSLQGSIFSKIWYLDALQVKYEILVIEENENIKAGIVLAKNEINTYANPMLDKYLGILFEYKEGNKQKIISKEYKYMELLISKLKEIQSFDYYFHPSFKNWIPFSWNNFTQQTRYTYILNLSNPLKEIESAFHTDIKRGIKNAIKHNIQIKEDIEFEEFYEIINKTFLRQGNKAPFNKEKIKKYIKTLKERDKFISFGAYDENHNLISVTGIVYDNKIAYQLFNGIDIKNQVRGANAYTIFYAIKYFHNTCNYYDFEGSMIFGVEQFFRRFNGEQVQYMRIWNDNFFNYAKSKAKKIYKKIRYGR